MTRDVAERFASETADHELEIVFDHGLYRHLRFRHAGPYYSTYYWFDLITVPGTLIFQGDGDAFVFSRNPDMFQFFRLSRGRINPGHWAEKVTSDRAGIKRYDEQLFRTAVIDDLKEFFGEKPVPEALQKAVQAEVLESEWLGTYEDAMRTVAEFAWYENEDDRWKHDKNPNFVFDHSWEWPVRDYDWWFLWACHAIVWGIAKYDAERPKPGRWRRLVRRSGARR